MDEILLQERLFFELVIKVVNDQKKKKNAT